MSLGMSVGQSVAHRPPPQPTTHNPPRARPRDQHRNRTAPHRNAGCQIRFTLSAFPPAPMPPMPGLHSILADQPTSLQPAHHSPRIKQGPSPRICPLDPWGFRSARCARPPRTDHRLSLLLSQPGSYLRSFTRPFLLVRRLAALRGRVSHLPSCLPSSALSSRPLVQPRSGPVSALRCWQPPSRSRSFREASRPPDDLTQQLTARHLAFTKHYLNRPVVFSDPFHPRRSFSAG
ncbi:hypothetical protein CCHR01_19256 [Colletotrichum chrysophilum]|uniref:Uncharacterized protein n=1 Tax=Colletotrichum chrysophilum TaxID=1836956 RepID=A0AAD8ZZ49_9PEZI|nr:hypothetical protein CCHR01_19256 [Colletotrichum chrysophilum]